MVGDRARHSTIPASTSSVGGRGGFSLADGCQLGAPRSMRGGCGIDVLELVLVLSSGWASASTRACVASADPRGEAPALERVPTPLTDCP
jgi:hypothetical protein